MSMTDRCDEIIRLIDRVLHESCPDGLQLCDEGTMRDTGPLIATGLDRRRESTA